ncbi:pilus assembly protein PilM [Erwinia sp. 9145]|uniref:type IV pilus biogenesis protein PilM n=1 Tax=Erwinia sp. 9145 TaxID=1500895 RepID=UPI000551A0B5|nr:pilus assembly protein PilM [Erwinia sp. 9145]
MAFQTWQVGLDIQNGQICALGIQRRRNGWQLRHWWQHALPQDTLTQGRLQRPEPLVALLQRWRKQLPHQISLRVGFPPQLVLQRQINLPHPELREPERSSYITAAARRFFPIELEALAIDYRQQKEQVYVTATQREAMQSWLACLAQADLTPQVLELTPAALYALAETLALDPAAALVHRLSDHWLWYSAALAGQRWGWCSSAQAPDFETLKALHLPEIPSVFYSSAGASAPPENTTPLNPLDATTLKQPPLPVHAGAFTLAAGLALRPEDV